MAKALTGFRWAIAAALTLAASATGAFAQPAQQTAPPATQQTKPQTTRQSATAVVRQPEAQIVQQPQTTKPPQVTQPPSTTKPPRTTRPPEDTQQPSGQFTRPPVIDVRPPSIQITPQPGAQVAPQPTSSGIVIATLNQAAAALQVPVNTYRPNDPGRPSIRIAGGGRYEEANKMFCTASGADILALIDQLPDNMLQACRKSRPNLYGMQIGSKSVVVRWLYMDGSNQKPDVPPLARHIAGYEPPRPVRDPPPARQPPKAEPPPTRTPVADPKPPPQVAVTPPVRQPPRTDPPKTDPPPKPTPVADPKPPPQQEPKPNPAPLAADPPPAPQPDPSTGDTPAQSADPVRPPADPVPADQPVPAKPVVPGKPAAPETIDPKWVAGVGALVVALAALAAFVRPRRRPPAPDDDARDPSPSPQVSARIVGSKRNGEDVSMRPATGKEIELRFAVIPGEAPDIQIMPDGSRR